MRFRIREAAEKAFRLAYFIHLDRQVAGRIAAHALSRLEVDVARQRKRRYYSPVGKVRTKVSLDELQALQSLVFHESEVFEKQQERAADFAGLGDADWLVRFVKHLIAITFECTSFYVALGICRLLFSYSTAETVCIYDTVRQDSERSKDDPYFRKRKIILMRRLEERFGSVLRTCHVSHGEERFVTREDSSRHLALVWQCLNMFRHWNTPCVLPERFNPVSDPIEALRFDGAELDDRHPVEIRRMHTLLHTDCYQRLVTALRFTPPSECLSVPVFFGSVADGHDDGPPGNDRLPDGLREEEFSEITNFVKRQTARRRKVAPDSLSVRVDGAEYTTLGLDAPRPVRITVDGDAKLVEVYGCDARGKILVANFLLSHNELLRARPAKAYSFRLDRARKLLLSVFPHTDAEGEIADADIELVYRRVGPFAFMLKLWGRPGADRPALAFATAGLALLVTAGILTGLTFFLRRSSTTQPAFEDVAQVMQPPISAPPPPVSATVPARRESQPEKGQADTPQRKQGVSKPPSSSASVNAAGRARRGGQPEEGARDFTFKRVSELLSVRLVYVEKHANGVDADLRESIKSRLAASQRLVVTDEPGGADAFLVWSVRRTPAGQRIDARLTDKLEQELWSGSQPISGGARNREAASQAASTLARNLLDEIARREGKTK